MRAKISRLGSRLWHAFDGLAEDTLWSVANEVLAVVAAIVSFRLLQEVLTNAEYGDYAALYGLVTTFSAVTYSGPGLALLQRRLRHHQPLNEIQSSFLSLTLLAGAVSTVVAVVLALLILPGLSGAEIAFIAASELFANSTIYVCAWLVQAAVSFPAMMRVRLVTFLLKLAAVPTLFVLDALSIRNLGAAYLVLYGGYALWLIRVRLPRIGYDVRFRRPPADALRSSTIFAVPLAAAQIQLDGDKVTLAAVGLRADGGLYAAAYRVVLLGGLPLRVLSQAAFHRFLPDDETGTKGYHLQRAARLTAFMFAVGVAVAGVLYATLRLAEPLYDLLIDEEFAEAKTIIPWLILFLPLVALSGTPMNSLLGLGRIRERAAIYLSSAMVSVVAYLALIPDRGWEGAVAATLLSEAYLVVASWSAMVYYQRLADRDRRPLTSVAEGRSA